MINQEATLKKLIIGKQIHKELAKSISMSSFLVEKKELMLIITQLMVNSVHLKYGLLLVKMAQMALV
jgi:hypothetical protein